MNFIWFSPVRLTFISNLFPLICTSFEESSYTENSDKTLFESTKEIVSPTVPFIVLLLKSGLVKWLEINLSISFFSASMLIICPPPLFSVDQVADNGYATFHINSWAAI